MLQGLAKVRRPEGTEVMLLIFQLVNAQIIFHFHNTMKVLIYVFSIAMMAACSHMPANNSGHLKEEAKLNTHKIKVITEGCPTCVQEWYKFVSIILTKKDSSFKIHYFRVHQIDTVTMVSLSSKGIPQVKGKIEKGKWVFQLKDSKGKVLSQIVNHKPRAGMEVFGPKGKIQRISDPPNMGYTFTVKLPLNDDMTNFEISEVQSNLSLKQIYSSTIKAIETEVESTTGGK